MPHFMIVLIPYINSLNLSWIKNVYFLRTIYIWSLLHSSLLWERVKIFLIKKKKKKKNNDQNKTFYAKSLLLLCKAPSNKKKKKKKKKKNDLIFFESTVGRCALLC